MQECASVSDRPKSDQQCIDGGQGFSICAVPSLGSGFSGTTSGGTTGGGGAEIGESCSADADCASGWCLFHPGTTVGYSSKECDSFSDCPSFWDCKEIQNAANKFWVKDE